MNASNPEAQLTTPPAPSQQETGTDENRELVITRVLDARRDLVFKAWTDPTLVAQWWSPTYFTIPMAELDVRPGGGILIHMQAPDGTIYPMLGEYREISQPERLVFVSSAAHDEEGNAGLEFFTTVTFDEVGSDKTRLTLRIAVVRVEPRAQGAFAGMEMGWNQSLDKLNEVVGRLAQA